MFLLSLAVKIAPKLVQNSMNLLEVSSSEIKREVF
jgi:hypothetical protein